MFGRLADPSGANNALSQVLYGLALRYTAFLLLFSFPSPFLLTHSLTLTSTTDTDGAVPPTLPRPYTI